MYACMHACMYILTSSIPSPIDFRYFHGPPIEAIYTAPVNLTGLLLFAAGYIESSSYNGKQLGHGGHGTDGAES